MATDPVERVRRLLDAFERRDLEALQALCTADVRVVPIRAALEDTDYSGPHAFSDFLEDVRNEWSALEMDMREFEARGADEVVAHGVLRATARASGVPVEIQVTAVCKFSGELLAEIQISRTATP